MIFHFVKKRYLKYLLVLIGLFAITFLLGTLQLKHPHVIPALSAIMAQNKALLTALRLGLIALFAYLWPWGIQKLSTRHKWPSEKTVFWLQQRWRMAAWLVLFELLLIDNLLGAFIKLF